MNLILSEFENHLHSIYHEALIGLLPPEEHPFAQH